MIEVPSAAFNLTTNINLTGHAPTPRDLEILESDRLNCGASWFVLAGGLSPNIDANFYSHITAKLRSRGARIAFVSSSAAFKTLLNEKANALPHLVKPNISELEDLLKTKIPTRSGVLHMALSLIARGNETLIRHLA